MCPGSDMASQHAVKRSEALRKLHVSMMRSVQGVHTNLCVLRIVAEAGLGCAPALTWHPSLHLGCEYHAASACQLVASARLCHGISACICALDVYKHYADSACQHVACAR